MRIVNIIQSTTENLTIDEISELLRMSEDNLLTLHHTLGQDIRNNYDLWFNQPLCIEFEKYVGSAHPDDISMYIIEKVWNNIQEDYKKE